MTKILYIYHTSTIGGGSYCLLNILKELDRTRFEPVVMLASYGPLVEEIRNMGIEVLIYKHIYSVPYNSTILRPKRILNMIKLWRNFNQYVDIVKQVKADVVYVNSMMLYPFLFIKKYYDCKTVVHIREHWPKKEHTHQRNYAEKTIAKYADRVIAINKFSAEMFDSLKDKSTVVYDWIDMSKRDQFFDLDTCFGEDTSKLKVFLFSGGYVPIKGLLDVLQVFASIKRDDIRLLVLGVPQKETYAGIRKFKKRWMDIKGEKSYQEQVIALMSIDNRIKCIPGTYNIKQILEKSSCLVSFFTIPHANLALAECLISGTPAIAADTEEAREYSDNGKGTLLFQINSKDGLKQQIETYLQGAIDIQEQVSECSPVISELFSSKRNAAILDKLYKTL